MNRHSTAAHKLVTKSEGMPYFAYIHSLRTSHLPEWIRAHSFIVHIMIIMGVVAIFYSGLQAMDKLDDVFVFQPFPSSVDWKQRVPVDSVRVSPDSSRLAVSGGGNEVVIYDLDGGKELLRLQVTAGPVRTKLWEDHHLVACTGVPYNMTEAGLPGEKGAIVVWDTNTWQVVRKLSLGDRVASAVAVVPDEHELVFAAAPLPDPYLSFQEGLSPPSSTIYRWNWNTGTRNEIKKLDEHVVGLFIDSKTKAILVGTFHGKFLRFGLGGRGNDVISRRLTDWDRTEMTAMAVSLEAGVAVFGVKHGGGSALVEVGLSDFTTCVHQLPANDYIGDIALSPSGKEIAVTDNNRILMCARGHEFELAEVAAKHERAIVSLAISPSGKFVASAGSYDGTARIWRLGGTQRR